MGKAKEKKLLRKQAEVMYDMKIGLKEIRRKWNGLVPLEEWTSGENLKTWQ